MNRAMNGIDFNSGDNVEASLLEAQTKASSAREQVDSDRSWQAQSPVFKYQLTRFGASCRSDFSPAIPEKTEAAPQGGLGTLSDIAKRLRRPIHGDAEHVCCESPSPDSSPALAAKTLGGILAGDRCGTRVRAKSSRLRKLLFFATEGQYRGFPAGRGGVAETYTRARGEAYAQPIPGRYPFRRSGTSTHYDFPASDCLPWYESLLQADGRGHTVHYYP
jgi:hypothetical protein